MGRGRRAAAKNHAPFDKVMVTAAPDLIPGRHDDESKFFHCHSSRMIHAQLAPPPQRTSAGSSNRIPAGRRETKRHPRPPWQYRTSCDGWWSKRPCDRAQHHAPTGAQTSAPGYARNEGATAHIDWRRPMSIAFCAAQDLLNYQFKFQPTIKRWSISGQRRRLGSMSRHRC